MHIHAKANPTSSCLGEHPLSQMDTETPHQPETSSMACNLRISQNPVQPLCMYSTGRAPPRVDSCPDMDTRPPLTPDLNVMEFDGDVLGLSFQMQELLSQLPTLEGQLQITNTSDSTDQATNPLLEEQKKAQTECQPCPLHIATGKGLVQKLHIASQDDTTSRGLLLTDGGGEELLNLFQYEEGIPGDVGAGRHLARLEEVPRNSPSPSCLSQEPGEPSFDGLKEKSTIYCSALRVPGPCDPEDLLDGVMFGAQYLGSTQLPCEKHYVASTHMRQAQEAVDRIKAPDGESQPTTEVDIMVSTRRVKVLSVDTQETLMDHALQTISYTADIGRIVVIMARRKMLRSHDQLPMEIKSIKMLCHVFQSDDAQLIAQAIGQAFGMAYQKFLCSEKIVPPTSGTSQVEEQMYNADLAHFSNRENCREVFIQKQRGEMLGVAVVESGWGSLLPTVVIANLMHGGPAERSGELSIGDHVTSVNGTSLVGLPFSTCQGLIRDLKGQCEVIMCIVRCPPVITAIVQRPCVDHQLGFCVEDGVICSLVRGGIAERGGIRVGHRIIEINGQSVVATAHVKIIQMLMDAIGEVHIKTMPASTYRLLTGQETPVYL
ncbi:hypothetical protein GDO86_000918 [Hymenochirus boettgeri]|uniref:Amyloid-beta A4 precursor protein-binding family A member 3 n=1 Tax=Hymenochirus boettgeri TaxID=247094 RepID=A0A8T2KJC4_9PIPI|nr:hypothetical protein GDO86_000918 [Hymenochirus boettgeri]